MCSAQERAEPRRDSFEVYGLDLHGPRRERLQPWLIEVNPGFKDLYLYPPRMLPLAAAAISLLPLTFGSGHVLPLPLTVGPWGRRSESLPKLRQPGREPSHQMAPRCAAHAGASCQ